jgi:hypothetical protein
MAFDAHANFGVSSVAVAPSPSTTGTSLTVATGEGTRFPAVPFNATLAPSGVLATPANAEIVRVTARSGDVLTITRAQEGSVARAVVVGDLCVASITAKALQDLETTAARTDVANTFVTDQVIAGSPYGRLLLRDTGQPVDARLFHLINYTQVLTLAAVNDVLSVASPGLAIDRVGNVKVGADLYEKQRTTPIGHWIDIPYNSTNFGAVTGSWTVTAANVSSHAYTLIGKTLMMAVQVANTSITGSPAELRVVMPSGVVAAKHTSASAQFLDLGTPLPNGNIQVVPGNTYVSLYRDMASASFPTSTGFYVLFTITAAIQ